MGGMNESITDEQIGNNEQLEGLNASSESSKQNPFATAG